MSVKAILIAASIVAFPSMSSAVTVLNGSFESDPGVKSQGANGGSHGRGRTFSKLPNTGSSWGIWTSGVEGWTSSKHGIEFQTQRTLGLKPAEGLYTMRSLIPAGIHGSNRNSNSTLVLTI